MKKRMKKQMKSSLSTLLLSVPFVFFVLLLPLAAQEPEIIEVGKFSALSPEAGKRPPEWEPLTFKKIEKHTRYELVSDHGKTALRAQSDGASSGLVRKIRIDPKAYPVIRWSWKAQNILEKGDVRTKDGDDYPARIYITFQYDSDRVGFFEKTKYEAVKLLYGEYPPLGAINYIWANKAPIGTTVPNPFTDKVIMIAVQSGRKNLGRWITEERNVYEDYKNAFGEAPPAISGVAVMTDSDNTGESAAAFYGDIVFVKGE